jgi:hypothetical protein
MKIKPYEPVIWFNSDGPTHVVEVPIMWEYEHFESISLLHLNDLGSEGWEVITAKHVGEFLDFSDGEEEPIFEAFLKRRVMFNNTEDSNEQTQPS